MLYTLIQIIIFMWCLAMIIKQDQKNIIVTNSRFPLIIESTTKNDIVVLEKWIQDNITFIQEQKVFLGAVLFRGFEIKTPQDFERIARLLDNDLCQTHPFDGGARMWLTKYIYEADTTTKKNADLPIPFHIEDSYIPFIPATIMFCCLKPAEFGGETIISDCRKVFSSLPKDLQKKYSEKTIKMTFTYPDSIFLVNASLPKNKSIISEFAKNYGAIHCKRIGESSTEFTFEVSPVIKINNKNSFSYIGRVHFADYLTYAIDIFFSYKTRKKINERVRMYYLIVICITKYCKCLWTSHLFKKNASHWCSFSDGKKIPLLDQIKITVAFWKNSKIVSLKSSDLIILNNLTISHGRLSYRGKRRLLSCIGSITDFRKDKNL